MITPANIPKKGSEIAVIIMVTPPIMLDSPPEVSAEAALLGNVTIAPKTNKKPVIEALGTYLPILGNNFMPRIIAMSPIIKTPAKTAWGALAVAEITTSTGPPPTRADPISARLLIMVIVSIFTVESAISAFIFPKAIFAPIFKQTIARDPRIIVGLSLGLWRINFSCVAFYQHQVSLFV